MSAPYISIVVASRNDNHGGDMLKRMRIFVNGLIHQCNKYKLPCELIFVEWNPPENSKPLKDVLPKSDSKFLDIRYIVVPQRVHSQLNNSERLPLFQMIAKNIGIRKSNAKFVLCTNVDLLFSDRLFERLSKQDLEVSKVYRANRCDVPNTLNENEKVSDQLRYCENNILKRLGKSNRYPNFTHTNGFLFKYVVFQPLLIVLSKIKALYARSPVDRFNSLDFDACGDFTLMSKEDWIRIQGYPELEIYSIHIDSMAMISTAAQNIEQVIFKWDECCYHLEHDGGWDFKSPVDRIYFYTKFPMLEWWAVREAGIHLIKNNENWNINKSNWGLLNVELQEF